MLTYGPWYVAGAPGKVKVELDSSMTPWSYGGWNEMNAAGAARVLNAVTNMQVSEAGLLELAGPPSCSLGDTLQGGGPNVSNIDVSYGKEGITTSYRFATFTPRFGVFSKQTADRIKRLGQTAMEVRKSLVASVNQAIDVQGAMEMAARGFMANAPKVVKAESPHEVLICHSRHDLDGSGNFSGWRVCPQSLTFEEAYSTASADNDANFRQTAMMSMDGLLRPYSTATSAVGMPGVAAPSNTTGPNAASLNPWASGNDVSYLAYGSTYNGVNSYRNGNDPASTRAMGLRAPVMLTGWGYDLQGNQVPGDGSGNLNCTNPPGVGSGHWVANVLRRADLWKAGPLDVAWDDERGVWTPPGNRMGVVALGSGIKPGASGVMTLVSGRNLLVWNPWSIGVSGVTVAAAYMADTNRWNIIAADCTS